MALIQCYEYEKEVSDKAPACPQPELRRKSRMVRRVFLAFLVLGLVACGDDVLGPEDIAGTYTLQSINGQSLPWAEAGVEVTAGSITLNQSMTCSRSITATMTDGGTVVTITDTDVCTHTFVNGVIAFTWDSDGSTQSGSIVGSQLTINLDGDVLIFRK
jgi:hypothetical protein